jgi:multiple sugar transport system substrate-binding protein
LPTSPELFDTLDKFQAPIYDKFNEALKYGEARPGVPVYPKISEELQIAIGTVLTEEATPEEALDRAYKASLAAYEEQKKERGRVGNHDEEGFRSTGAHRRK